MVPRAYLHDVVGVPLKCRRENICSFAFGFVSLFHPLVQNRFKLCCQSFLKRVCICKYMCLHLFSFSWTELYKTSEPAVSYWSANTRKKTRWCVRCQTQAGVKTRLMTNLQGTNSIAISSPLSPRLSLIAYSVLMTSC